MVPDAWRPAVKKIYWSLIAIGLIVLLLAFVAFIDRNPDPPALLDQAGREKLFQIAHLSLSGEGSDETPLGEVAGAIVAVYDGKGESARIGWFHDDLTTAVNAAAKRLLVKYVETGRIQPKFLSVHILRDMRRVGSTWLREKGFGYHRGLSAVIKAEGKKAYAFSDVDMHVRGYRLDYALKKLKENRGLPMYGNPPKKGAFLATTESYTEDDQGRIVRLYRASTLLSSVDSDMIMQSCRLGGDYLCNLLRNDNQFLYEGDVGRDKYHKAYNLLRHAGTIYSLYQLHLATNVPRYRETADRAWRWLLAQIKTDRDENDQICAFPVEKGNVKLGGAGLTLIALSEKLSIERREADLELGRQLARHILRSQRKNGSFQSYWPYKNKKAKRRRSIYYPGEAMLGLMRFYKHEPNEKYVEAVARGAGYYIHERWRIIGLELNVPPDAWLMLALNELHKVKPQKDVADYCLKLADGMMNDQFLADWLIPYPDYRGGFFPYPPMVTPAGARIEGLTAAYRLAQRVNADTKDLRRTIVESARFQIERVIRPEFVHLYPNRRRGLGAFRHSPTSNRIRIDFNQHNISGLLISAQIMAESQ